MILALSTRADTALTFRLADAVADSEAWMHSRRFVLAVVVVVASVLDLVLTQTILTMVHGLPGAQPAEANPLMAGVVMTWWAWPLRVGIPVVAITRDLRVGNYTLITFAAALYTTVVIWNTNMLVTVQGALT